MRTRVWLTLGSGTRFCNGKVALLEAVDRLGSLRKAAEDMAMSYRHAWGMVRELDEAAGFAFLEHSAPGTKTALRLTKEGKQFIAKFRQLQAPVERLVDARFKRSFNS